ncbi:hypothetical protein BpHYR1_037137 [Brachionus plicatilis]|uniref:Uncharacterized protein n=1 Tax=Brachionus plicatilis TaxID=10195 RepID=A0A3M7T1Z1_BRAPC|nr:hypothetical protein BpHYR1_037137 [Brachionus plicatilis]
MRHSNKRKEKRRPNNVFVKDLKKKIFPPYCCQKIVGLDEVRTARVIEQKRFKLFYLLHLSLNVLDVGIVGALVRGQLHSVDYLESLAFVFQRVGVRVLQVIHLLVKHAQLAARFVELDGRPSQLAFQVGHTRLAQDCGKTRLLLFDFGRFSDCEQVGELDEVSVELGILFSLGDLLRSFMGFRPLKN